MTTFIGGVRIINDWERSTRKWENIERIVNDEITSMLVDAATQGVNIAKYLVGIPYGSGSSYDEGGWFGKGKRVIGQASAPGEPPRRRTGELQESIDILMIQRFMVEFGSNLDYSFFLEMGTSKILPRPHILPAGMEASKLFPELLFTKFTEATR